MEIKGLVEALKDFIWDIVGYLLPGFILILLFIIFSNEYLFLHIPIKNFDENLFGVSLLSMSYAAGHVVFGVSNLIDTFLNKKITKYSKDAAEAAIKNHEPYKISVSLVNADLKLKDEKTDANNMNIRELRNYVMSYFPENDRKVYTFMFRSDISNHLISICIVVAILGLISSGFYIFKIPFVLKGELKYVLYYLLLLLLIFPLYKTKMRFYRIALNIPFSIFNSNFKKK